MSRGQPPKGPIVAAASPVRIGALPCGGEFPCFHKIGNVKSSKLETATELGQSLATEWATERGQPLATEWGQALIDARDAASLAALRDQLADAITSNHGLLMSCP